jgi:hypothetical protein
MPAKKRVHLAGANQWQAHADGNGPAQPIRYWNKEQYRSYRAIRPVTYYHLHVLPLVCLWPARSRSLSQEHAEVQQALAIEELGKRFPSFRLGTRVAYEHL